PQMSRIANLINRLVEHLLQFDDLVETARENRARLVVNRDWRQAFAAAGNIFWIFVKTFRRAVRVRVFQFTIVCAQRSSNSPLRLDARRAYCMWLINVESDRTVQREVPLARLDLGHAPRTH